MTQPKFTPGPWTYLAPSLMIRAKGCSVAEVIPQGSISEGNAALIAAAPDLYAALEEAEAFVAAWACHHATQGATTIDDYAKATSPEGWHPTHRKIYENVRAALAKAGKQ